jgi:hypothetical protein
MLRLIVQLISWLAILGTILPSSLYLVDQISLDRCQWLMLVATIIWFVVTPLWMGRKER